jgi:hypothetical protein
VTPPLHITGQPNVDWIIFIVGALLCLYWLRALRLAREGARLFLRNILKAIILFSACMALLTASATRTHLLPSQEMVMAGFVALIFFGRWQGKRRSRYIPKSTRRAVIARDLKGEKFDPTKHHVDHVWPFARGGSHTSDNLRVIDKKRNLQKGAKRPRMRDMW